jgi:tRNA threonylcarbamoyladenosine modification (KEOPS) complex  Pcc1 subunit
VITLEYDDERTAEAIANAVSPDNRRAPLAIGITTVRKEKSVITEIYAETGLARFIATIDDLLSSTSIAEKTLKIVQEG